MPALTRAWVWFLLAGSLLVGVYSLLPAGGFGQAVVQLAGSFAMVGAIVVGIRRYAPRARSAWYALLVGTAIYTAANCVWFLYPLIAGRPLPYPSAADVLFILGYLGLLAGLAGLVLARAMEDRAALIEALVVTLGLSLFWWVVIIGPYLELPGLTASQRAVSVAYPLIDVMLVGVLVALVTVPGRRPAAFWLLAGSVLAQTGADTHYATSLLQGTFSAESASYLGWLLSYTFLGSAVLHPSMRELSQPGTAPSSMPRLRLVMLSAGAAAAPLLLVLRPAVPSYGIRVVALLALLILALVVTRLRMVMVDASQLRRAQAELRESEARYRTILGYVPVVVYEAEAGPTGRWTYVSPQIERLLGFTQEEWLADPHLWLRRIHPDDRDRVVAEELRLVEQAKGRAAADSVIPLEYRMVRGDGRIIWVRDEAFAVPDEIGELSKRLRGVLVDITERKVLEEQLEHRALYDPLTGLANRVLFVDRVRHALAGADRQPRSVAILLIDLNRFKAVNDTLGHAAGDQLLAEFAERIRGSVRPTDTAARLGGDEFAILVEDLGSGQADLLAQRILDGLQSPFRLEGGEIVLDACIGIGLAGDTRDPDRILRDADTAMYAAKRKGKGGFEVYRAETHADVLRTMELGTELRRAVERRELFLQYQPLVTLPAGQIVGVEALVRWNHPKRGMVPPAEFIPMAEESGLILAIDRWVLGEACRQARKWARVPGQPALGMHVNISARQLHDDELVSMVSDVLAESGIEPRTLTLEFTEGTLMKDTKATFEILTRLRGLGVRLAIDDFGIGFSSLSYLRRLPVDVVKIDRSFVSGIAAGAEEWSLARGIIRLLHSLGLETVAEGIEHADQMAHLQALGCRYGQGYYFARPAEPGTISELLANRSMGQRTGARSAP